MKRTNAVANAIIMYGPIATALLFVAAMSPLLSISILMLTYIVGLTKLVKSKISVFRPQQWLTFGPSKMDAKNRAQYLQGYATISFAAGFNIIAIALTQIQ